MHGSERDGSFAHYPIFGTAWRHNETQKQNSKCAVHNVFETSACKTPSHTQSTDSTRWTGVLSCILSMRFHYCYLNINAVVKYSSVTRLLFWFDTMVNKFKLNTPGKFFIISIKRYINVHINMLSWLSYKSSLLCV